MGSSAAAIATSIALLALNNNNIKNFPFWYIIFLWFLFFFNYWFIFIYNNLFYIRKNSKLYLFEEKDGFECQNTKQ